MCRCFAMSGMLCDSRGNNTGKKRACGKGGGGILLLMTVFALTDFSQALARGSAHAWLFIPTAIFLGALHGLEPGHSKTMMAAFIVAIRGTIPQAPLLGLSAAISHSLLIWVLAAAALKYGSQ